MQSRPLGELVHPAQGNGHYTHAMSCASAAAYWLGPHVAALPNGHPHVRRSLESTKGALHLVHCGHSEALSGNSW